MHRIIPSFGGKHTINNMPVTNTVHYNFLLIVGMKLLKKKKIKVKEMKSSGLQINLIPLTLAFRIIITKMFVF